MGTDVDISNGTLYINSDDGPGIAWNGIKSIESDETFQPADDAEPFSVPTMPTLVTMSLVDKNKRNRCHSRKRFIKLLMSMGVERNMAVGYASLLSTMNRGGIWLDEDGTAHRIKPGPNASYQTWWLRFYWWNLGNDEPVFYI